MRDEPEFGVVWLVFRRGPLGARPIDCYLLGKNALIVAKTAL